VESQTQHGPPTLPSVGNRDWYPLSLEQHRFYAVERFSEDVRSASIPIGLEMDGALNPEIFAASLPILVRRHPSLRTIIREIEGNPVQVILADSAVALAQHDLVDLGETERKARIDQLIEKELKRPFDLQAGPLYRFLLLKCAPDRHVFLLAFHHIIADFLSIGVFLDELSSIYTALLDDKPVNLPELTTRYVDFSSWEREFFSKEYLETTLKFWRDALKNNCSPHALPYDRASSSQQVFGCLSEVLDFESEAQARVSAFCRANNVNKFVLYLAAVSTLVHGYTENERMVIGIPLGNRNFGETKSVMGTFANQSVAIVDLSEDPTFFDLFARLATSLHATMTHVVPIIDVVNILRKELGAKQRPLQVVLTYLKDLYRTNIPGVSSRPIKTGRDTIDVDLFFTVIKHTAGEALSIEYADALFDPQTIGDMLERFQVVLDLIMSDPSKRTSEIFSSNVFQRRPSVRIASTFVAEPVAKPLQFWTDRLKTRSKIEFCPQGQVFQQLVDPTSAFFTNRDGYNVLLIRLQDWTSTTLSPSCSADELERAGRELDGNVSDFLVMLRRASESLYVPTIVVVTPDAPSLLDRPEWSAIVSRVQSKLSEQIGSIEDVSLITSRAILSLYDLSAYYDAARDSLGHIPYTDSFYVSLATAISRRIFSLRTSQEYKVLVVDCDNTLWRGVVAEDGADGILISRSMQAFQERLVRLQQSGMVVCLCSKNLEQDVLEVFERRPEMVLQLEHVVSRKINWASKSTNIRELALELNLGLDSFVFVDDNPAECAEVRANCPQVLCLQFPSSDDDIVKFLDHTWLFDRESGTAEDSKRTLLYRENAEREQYRTGFESYRTFIENLDLKVDIQELRQDDLTRVSQLTYRTNQFNTTTIRRSETELTEMIRAGWGCSTVRVKDRFGDYGLVGVMTHALQGDDFVVDTMLLSCRALGKGVEHKMIATLGSLAAARDCEQVRIPTRSTAKNQPVLTFLDQIAGEHRRATQDGADYIVPTAVAKETDFLAALESPDGANVESRRAGDPTTGNGLQDARGRGHTHDEFLSTTWKNYGALADVEKEIGTPRSRPPGENRSGALARTDTEGKLVEICSDVIGVHELGVEDDIFDLGGTSFDVVKIISRINETFKLSFDHHAFLRSPVVRDLAYQIDHYGQHGVFDDGVGAVDLEAEARLAPEITADGRAFKFETRPRSIFVTGATGFLGAHLLRDLLEQTAAAVHCLVRASNEEHGTSRLIENLTRYQLWKPEYRGRLHVVLGDLAKPRLGMAEREYTRLSEEIDIIYHNGSVVDFIKPYRALKNGNVGGTEEVLRLACVNRIQPVVYVSTVALFNNPSTNESRSPTRIAEAFVQGCARPPLGGYAQSKWVAERLMAIASSRGLPVCVVRPGEIAGSSETGHLNDADILSILLRAMVGMHCLPELETSVDFIPVDLLSRLIVRIASRPESIGRVYNMVHPEPVGLLEYAREVNALGMDVSLVPYTEWTARLARYAEKTNDDRIRSLMPLFTENVPGQGKSWIECTADRAEVAIGNTAKYLNEGELRAYRIDRALIGKYLSRLD